MGLRTEAKRGWGNSLGTSPNTKKIFKLKSVDGGVTVGSTNKKHNVTQTWTQMLKMRNSWKLKRELCNINQLQDGLHSRHPLLTMSLLALRTSFLGGFCFPFKFFVAFLKS
ncbi:hypothetical protein GOP47_0025374 [Adiantum capillus-veneris]|uniref:Uncharacterized protein n=1 Tax=Adiantum capillus-veneris TaxID=13818 RepID=A0A9D4U1C7_ADICA|nr:hypothetical protein GOP47_0025374 [Adiantum capillus-veneris]